METVLSRTQINFSNYNISITIQSQTSQSPYLKQPIGYENVVNRELPNVVLFQVRSNQLIRPIKIGKDAIKLYQRYLYFKQSGEWNNLNSNTKGMHVQKRQSLAKEKRKKRKNKNNRSQQEEESETERKKVGNSKDPLVKYNWDYEFFVINGKTFTEFPLKISSFSGKQFLTQEVLSGYFMLIQKQVNKEVLKINNQNKTSEMGKQITFFSTLWIFTFPFNLTEVSRLSLYQLAYQNGFIEDIQKPDTASPGLIILEQKEILSLFFQKEYSKQRKRQRQIQKQKQVTYHILTQESINKQLIILKFQTPKDKDKIKKSIEINSLQIATMDLFIDFLKPKIHILEFLSSKDYKNSKLKKDHRNKPNIWFKFCIWHLEYYLCNFKFNVKSNQIHLEFITNQQLNYLRNLFQQYNQSEKKKKSQQLIQVINKNDQIFLSFEKEDFLKQICHKYLQKNFDTIKTPKYNSGNNSKMKKKTKQFITFFITQKSYLHRLITS
ncbi:hypothetical protein M0812_22940 [Anaeramoeba flamelloides]|uniref:Uncharacterized protein n=1 Tax=Anaeramoeba flamelloides TaxID=1746091 RepID=A0AAV7YPQ7_9EUKA|nr:hypothetical protein M0812_22940 [Anaeramoeba flamelloides]